MARHLTHRASLGPYSAHLEKHTFRKITELFSKIEFDLMYCRLNKVTHTILSLVIVNAFDRVRFKLKKQQQKTGDSMQSKLDCETISEQGSRLRADGSTEGK